MVYSLAANVRLIVNTSLTDTDLTALIVMSDQEIVDRGLSGRSTEKLKLLSMFITAKRASFRDPSTRSIGEYSETLKTPEDFDREIERLIRQGTDMPFMTYNESV